MTDKPRRKFSVLDVILLVAAIALSYAWVKSYNALEHPEPTDQTNGVRSEYPHIVGPLFWVRTWAPLWLGPATAALFAMQLFRREERAGVLSRPGAVAGLIVVVLAAITAGAFGIQAAMEANPANYVFTTFTRSWSGFVGPAVLGIWVVMALRKKWTSSPSWAECAARVAGACWILIFCAEAGFLVWSEKMKDPMPVISARGVNVREAPESSKAATKKRGAGKKAARKNAPEGQPVQESGRDEPSKAASDSPASEPKN